METTPKKVPSGHERTILGLPRNIFFLGLTSFFNDSSSEMVYAIFPAFFTSVLHTGAASLGLVDGIAEAASNIFKVSSGSLSDRFHRRKPFVVAGYTLSVITRPLYLAVGSVFGALGLRFIDRVGKGVRDAPRDAIISFSTPSDELGRAFGYHRTMDTLGAILGPLAAFVILSFFPLHFDYVFMTAFAVGICALMTLGLIKDVKSLRDARAHLVPLLWRGGAERRGGPAFAFSRPFKWHLAAMLVLSFGSIPVSILLLKTQSLGLMIADIPLFYMIYNVSYAGLSFSAGEMSDKIGARWMLCIGYLFLIASYAILVFAESWVVLALGFLVLGFFPAMTDGVGRALASQLTEEDVRGSALGILGAMAGFGALASGILFGFLWQHYSPATACTIASAATLCGLMILVGTARASE